MFATLFRSLVWVTAGLGVAVVGIGARSYADRNTLETTSVHVDTAIADNPRVAPGLVRWHDTFEHAKNASSKSGKPVLLFHMMGQLDRQFC